MLRDQSGAIVGGLESPLLAQSIEWGRGFSVAVGDAPIVRVHHDGENHWITSYRAEGTNRVVLYDSLNNQKWKPSLYLSKQIAQNYRTTDPDITIEYANVQCQSDSLSCGYFVLAYAVDLCSGVNPETVTHTIRDAGRHIMHCLEAGAVTPFPRSKEALRSIVHQASSAFP